MDWFSREVPTPSGTFLVRHAGAGPGTLLYLHDQHSSAPPRLAELLAEDFQVVAPVLPGFGAAPRPAWVNSVRDLGDALLSLVDELGLSGFVLGGTSLGAWVAAELALRCPDRVRAMALLAPVGLWKPGAQPADHWFLDGDDRVDLLFSDPANAPEIDLEEYIANDESAARYGWSPRFADQTLEHRLHRLDMPALVVFGGEDRFLPSAHGDAWAGCLRGATVEQVPGAGHLVTHEQPDAVASLVRRFTARAGAEVLA